jgi:HSP20 family protein
MKLTAWKHRNELTSLRSEFDDLINRFFHEPATSHLPEAFTRSHVPPLNLAESEKSWTVTVELPGVEEKDIHVQLMGNQLIIKGERKWEEEKKTKEFHRVESQFGAFERVVSLPTSLRLDPDAVKATCNRGMLEIVIPKVEPTPATKIPVRSA